MRVFVWLLLVLPAAVAAGTLAGCFGGGRQDDPTARSAVLVVEGEVLRRVDSTAVRVGASGCGQGILVLLPGRSEVWRGVRIRVTGRPRTLQLPELEREVGLDLGRYRAFEGEEVLVASSLEQLSATPQPRRQRRRVSPPTAAPPRS